MCCLVTPYVVPVLLVEWFFKVNIQMSGYKDSLSTNNESFHVIGSQINLTPRSEKIEFYEKNCRPFSAAYKCTNATKQRTKVIRPKSAEFSNYRCKFLNPPISQRENKSCGESSLAVSNFTNLSTNLLKNLLDGFDSTKSFEPRRHFSKSLSQLPSECPTDSQKNLNITDKENKNVSEPQNLCEDLKLKISGNICDKNTSTSDSVVQFKLPEITQEKAVKFSEQHSLNFAECEDKCSYNSNHEKCCVFSEEESKHCQTFYSGQRLPKTNTSKILEMKYQTPTTKNRIETDSSSLSSNEFLEGEQKYSQCTCTESKKSIEKCCGAEENQRDLMFFHSLEEDFPLDKFSEKSKCSILSSSENVDEKPFNNEIDKTNTELNYDPEEADPTYEDIVLLLRTLEEEEDEEAETLNLEAKEDMGKSSSLIRTFPKEKTDYQFAISSYLQELEAEDSGLNENYENLEKWNSGNITSPRLEELLNKNSVELAHEVFSLKIQIEDQKRGIKLLKDTLSEMKEAKKISELEHQEALNKVTSETEALVQRHQKFIKQLLNEKKNLNETVSKLVQDLKSEEERYKRNIKAIEEKHSIEIKRAKEAQAAADKIKREKWMESKTQKIKEMTVKGLEPELSRMASRQQEELTELRNLHKAELEAVELRAARRNSELMDELRAELTKEKERAIAKETSTLRSELEKEYENEKNKLQHYIQTLKDRIRREEEKLSNQELDFQQRLIEIKQEEERKRQKIIREHQESLEELRRQHLIEIKNIKEFEANEKEISLNNLKKQQAAKFLEREAELNQQYKRERDREIELVIEALERESAQIQSELNATNEGKLKRLKDKMEAEIKEIEASESSLKVKLSETKSKLLEKEDFIANLQSQNRQLQTELEFFKKLSEEMSSEKANLKEIIRGEFETSINNLVKEKESFLREIAALKEQHLKELTKKDQLNVQAKYEMQKELTRVYSRIKTAVNKKEKVIESLREENTAINQKCRQLEIMLDQQRRNLLLQ